jgi:hypothetical protein
VHFAETARVIHIPAVVAVTSPFPPSNKIGIKSVQREEELIVPMKEMKMDWIPFLPSSNLCAVERSSPHIFTLKCTQRRAALKQLHQERIKKYEYCLPYIYSPLKEDDAVEDSIVSIMYPFENEAQPPVVCEFDWEFDEFDEFVSNLEGLPESEREKFMAFLKERVGTERKKVREAKQARKKALEEMSQDLLLGFQNMKFFKFYPVQSDKYPDISEMKSSFINRYYGRATEVL